MTYRNLSKVARNLVARNWIPIAKVTRLLVLRRLINVCNSVGNSRANLKAKKKLGGVLRLERQNIILKKLSPTAKERITSYATASNDIHWANDEQRLWAV